VLLPEVVDYRPKGEPPLASNPDFINVPCPICGKPGRRDGGTRWTRSSIRRGTPALHRSGRTTRRRS